MNGVVSGVRSYRLDDARMREGARGEAHTPPQLRGQPRVKSTNTAVQFNILYAKRLLLFCFSGVDGRRESWI